MNKKVKNLVVDSGAFIFGCPIQDYAENIYTLSEVVDEIKDENTRQNLQVLPYEIKYREPTDEDLKFVANFAKKTGDFRQLSVTDMKVIALTVRLEKELNDGKNLKEAPPSIQIVSKTSNTNASSTIRDLEFFGYDVKSKLKSDNLEDDLKEEISEENNNKDSKNNEKQITENKTEDQNDLINSEGEDKKSEESEVEEVIIEEDEGWITKDNCEEVRQKLLGFKFNEQDDSQLTLGCITGDYAMQNVLMQMGLNVISPKDGLHIKQTRQFVLRCYACFRINPPTANQFCKYCGNMKTLKRVSVTINQDGSMKMNINFKKPINIRGTKYSLPMPRAGKHANNPIVCEDQHLPQQRKSKIAVQEKKRLTVESILNDPDYLLRSNPFSLNDVYSRASRVMTKQRTVINPNETRKPTGNKKKKKNRHV